MLPSPVSRPRGAPPHRGRSTVQCCFGALCQRSIWCCQGRTVHNSPGRRRKRETRREPDLARLLDHGAGAASCGAVRIVLGILLFPHLRAKLVVRPAEERTSASGRAKMFNGLASHSTRLHARACRRLDPAHGRGNRDPSSRSQLRALNFTSGGRSRHWDLLADEHQVLDQSLRRCSRCAPAGHCRGLHVRRQDLGTSNMTISKETRHDPFHKQRGRRRGRTRFYLDAQVLETFPPERGIFGALRAVALVLHWGRFRGCNWPFVLTLSSPCTDGSKYTSSPAR